MQSLREYGILPADTAIDGAYAWFLQQYHAVQEAYKNQIKQHGSRPVTTAVPFNGEDFRNHQATILNFMQVAKG